MLCELGDAIQPARSQTLYHFSLRGRLSPLALHDLACEFVAAGHAAGHDATKRRGNLLRAGLAITNCAEPLGGINIIPRKVFMSTEGTLRRIARELAEYDQQQVAYLDEQVAELRRQLAEKEAARDAARAAPARLATYKPVSGADTYCPNCWIERGDLSPLRGIGGGTKDYDLFRCRDGHTIEVPF